MNTFLQIAPYALLLLASLGFILNLIADHFHVQHRMKIGIALVILACLSVAVMR